MKTIKNKLADFIYPENIYCMCCGDSIDPKNRDFALCNECLDRINWIFDDPFAATIENYAFDEVCSCCIYGYFPRQIIHKFKLGKQNFLAKPIAQIMTERFLQNHNPKDFCAVCFVPSSENKKKARGYNQAELLAKIIADNLNLPLCDYLCKAEDSQSFRLSGGDERRNLSEGRFTAKQNAAFTGNKKVILVDDVLTTGSTANEAARLLRFLGAREIVALVFASSGGDRLYGNREESINQ